LDEAGKNAIKGFLKGFTSKNKSAKKEVNDFVNGLVASVKKQLGIKSPSRVFMDIANQMVNGLIYGWDKAIGTFDDDVTNSLNFDSGYIGTFGGSYDNSYLGNGSVGRPINITQNIYAQKKSAAQLMQEARWQAQMGVLANA
jgi:phage-related protein